MYELCIIYASVVRLNSIHICNVRLRAIFRLVREAGWNALTCSTICPFTTGAFQHSNGLLKRLPAIPSVQKCLAQLTNSIMRRSWASLRVPTFRSATESQRCLPFSSSSAFQLIVARLSSHIYPLVVFPFLVFLVAYEPCIKYLRVVSGFW